jgi:tRNA pseudouridine55 synthase
MNRSASRREAVHGVLWLDKPSAISSNDALMVARRSLNAQKAGHGGTLDPMATGLLPLAFGEATKFLDDLLQADKTYQAVMRLGQTTNTGDAQGETIATSVVPDQQQASPILAELIKRFTGKQQQVPPMVSALKHQGQPLYKLARAGIEIERSPRDITVHYLRLIDLPGVQWPNVAFEAHVSKGTYIRTLAQDLGAGLGCGAHLIALRRTAVGSCKSASIGLEQLKTLAAQSIEQARTLLLPVDELVLSLPKIDVPDDLVQRLKYGQRLGAQDLQRLDGLPESGLVRLYGQQQFFGTGCLLDQRLSVQRLVHQTTITPFSSSLKTQVATP